MPNILPVSDLRNYNEVLKNCQVGEPVFLTKNGRGKFVVMDIEDYEREKAENGGQKHPDKPPGNEPQHKGAGRKRNAEPGHGPHQHNAFNTEV